MTRRDRPDQRVALVTGGSRGIGRATSLALADRGYDVAIVARSQGPIDEAVSQVGALGGTAVGYQTDVRDSEEVWRLAREVRDDLGPVSVLVNNAGASFNEDFSAGSLMASDEDDLRGAWELNTMSVFLCSRALVPHMRELGTGSIVNITSILATRVMRGLGSYASAKAATLSLTQTMALELAPEIRVNAVLPGHTATDQDAEKRSSDELSHLLRHVALGRQAQPDEIASVVAYFASEAASFITAAAIEVHGGTMQWCEAGADTSVGTTTKVQT